jgi:hypothetical protein
MNLPKLPNDKWVVSVLMPGWAVCFDEADTENFLRKMHSHDGGRTWERGSRLSAEEIVQGLRKESLRAFWPVLQAKLDAMHAFMAAEQRRGIEALASYGVAMPAKEQPK